MPASTDVPLIASGSQEKPELPESRVRDGWQAHAIYRKLEYDDRNAELARANIDYQIDGGAPYSEAVLRDAGRGEDANVNFREARAEDDLAQTPFIEMGTVSSTLWRIATDYGNEDERKKYSTIISQEFTKTIRKWGEDFDYYRQKLAQQFTRHGAGFSYFEDELDWRWRADGFGAFKLPRNTESRASAIPYCICKRSMSVTELYSFIRKEERAKEVGRWNVEAVKQALLWAATTNNRVLYNYAWEDFQKEIKENDVEFGSRCEQVPIYHLWVIEYDNQVSHYIGLQDGVAMTNGKIVKPSEKSEQKSDMVGNGFLYAHRSRFPNFKSCIIPFFYAIGTHATVHTIRGQGEMNFAPLSISNRVRCTMIDCAKAASMILLGADSPAEAENFGYFQAGPFMVRYGLSSKIEPTAFPDVTQRLQPLLTEMGNLRRAVSPSAMAPAPIGKSKQPETKYSIQARQNSGGALNSAMLTQWFGPFGKLGEESYRRMVNPKLRQDDPGGKEAFEFRARCLKQGVPAEAMLMENCTVEAVRVIGNGSPEMRQYSAEQIWELRDALDTPGQKKALMALFTSFPGVDFQAAEDFVGPLEPRQPVDQQIALMENSIFTMGAPAKVTGEQNHWVHCQVHEEIVKQFVDEFDQGQIDGATLVKVLKPSLDNMLDHSEYLSKDKTREKESAQVRKFIQNNSGKLQQQQEKLIAQMQREQQAQQPQEGAAPDPEQQRKNEVHAAKIVQMQQEMQNRQQEFNLRMALQQQDAHNQARLADLQAAHDIALKTAELASV